MLTLPRFPPPSSLTVALVVPALILGVLVATQWRAQERRTPFAARYTLELAEAVDALQKEQRQLRDELVALQARLDGLQREAASRGGEAADLRASVESLKAQAGLTPLVGPGVVVTLDDAKLPATAKDVVLAIVHSTDITDVLNAAWKGGAEAIAVNGERIAGTSACVGAVIQINSALLSPPYVISIIGPPERLLATLDAADELRDIKARARYRGLGFAVAQASDLRVPAYSGPLRTRHARVVERP